MSEADRQDVAAAQRRLLNALAGGKIPDGFDQSRIALTARTLRNKRASLLAKRRPALAQISNFASLFDEFVRQRPQPAEDDDESFYKFVSATEAAPDPVRLEQLACLARRRGIAATRLSGTARFAIALRIPMSRKRVWVLSFGK